MKSDWMGRYQEITYALILHGNVIARTQTVVFDIGEGIVLNSQQWQILEYIVCNRDKTFSMNDISYRLNIPQSTLSKTVKMLCKYGLVDKYQAVNNRKNIILRPSEHGLHIYTTHSINSVRPVFESFFNILKSVSDEDLHTVAKAIETLDNEILPERKEEIELIKLEKRT